MRALYCVAVAAVMVGGCASGGPTGSQVTTAKLASSEARIVIYRTSPLGFALQPSYTIDGKAVGNSQPAGFVACKVRPGAHKVTVANAARGQALGGGTDQMTVNVAAGRTTYLLASPQLGLLLGEIHLTQVTEAQGQAETATLSQIASSC